MPKTRSKNYFRTQDNHPNAEKRVLKRQIKGREDGDVLSLYPGLLQNLAVLLQATHLALLLEHLPAHLEHHLEALFSLSGVLLEAVDGELLDVVADLLPPAAQRGDLGALVEGGLGGRGRGRGLVDARLPHAEQVRPRHVHAAEGDFFAARVDVRGLVDERGVLAAEDAENPLGRRLLAGDEALGAELEVAVSCDG